MKSNKGITLIALVITILILIILAVVTIKLSLGNNGLFKRAKFATESYINEQYLEKTHIAEMANEVDTVIGTNRGQTVSKGTLSITKNGEYDVSEYEKVNVNVSNNMEETNVVSLIPIMTSNTEPSGTVQAGSVYSGRQAWWAFSGESPNANNGDGYWFPGS